jgi:hypothetical protein
VFSLHTTEEVLVDLLAVVLGDKPVPLSVNLSEIVPKNEDTYIVASSWCKSGNRFDNARELWLI